MSLLRRRCYRLCVSVRPTPPLCCSRSVSSLPSSIPRRRCARARPLSSSPSHSRFTDTTIDLGLDTDATVYALATGGSAATVRSGVAVVRVSGRDAVAAYLALTRRSKAPTARLASLCSLRHPVSGETIDSHALALHFAAPKSFTGETVVEFHCHGSPVVVSHLLEALNSCRDHLGIQIRAAEAGEFTRRALMHSKMDLMQCEALADLLNADTKLQAKQALRQMEGQVSQVYEEWRKEIVDALAHVEAVIDFAEDEDDVGEATVMKNVSEHVAKLVDRLEHQLKDSRKGELLRDGVKVTLVGPANVGKSSLLNRLMRREISIVHDQAGTTRDVVESSLNLGGFVLSVADTAGIRDTTTDLIEIEGVRRAKNKLESSDLAIVVLDSSSTDVCLDPYIVQLARQPGNAIVIANKSDLCSDELASCENVRKVLHLEDKEIEIVPASCKTGDGLDQVLDTIRRRVEKMVSLGETDECHLITRSRHRQHISDALASLKRSLCCRDDIVLQAEELRMAVLALSRLFGKVDVDDVLDVIFRDFCIGK